MTRGRTRIRALIADNYRTLLVICLVASALAGVVAADTLQPQSSEVTEQRTLYEPTASVSHGADVVTETPVFDRERLENRPVYFANISPVISGNVTVGHEGDATLNTTVETAVVLRAVGESDESNGGDGTGGDATVYWERTFARTTISATLDGGDRLTVPYAVNATALFDRVAAIQRALDSNAGQTTVFLRATVHRRGSVGERTVDHTEQHRVRFTGDGTAVRVEPAGFDPSPATVPEQRTVTEQPGGPVVVATVVGAAAVWLVTLWLVAVGAAARYRGFRIAPSDAARARAEFERERDEFAEWITAGTVPSSVRERTTVEVDSLTGLVDVGIDTDSRVIESTDDGRFYVLDGDLCYVYEPPPEPTTEDDDVLAGTDDDGATFEFPDENLPEDGVWNESTVGAADDNDQTSEGPVVSEEDD